MGTGTGSARSIKSGPGSGQANLVPRWPRAQLGRSRSIPGSVYVIRSLGRWQPIKHAAATSLIHSYLQTFLRLPHHTFTLLLASPCTLIFNCGRSTVHPNQSTRIHALLGFDPGLAREPQCPIPGRGTVEEISNQLQH
jgi:hypothetical protein